ncbi:MAG: SynChlorMet cassette protein ScmD [Candidatus Omnitrophica bacterium]|nr:SynChlorMet cassette protein ScmD [Candidatus Omnitrophota bacterium]
MEGNDLLVANPMIVLREEFDDWALLFDPDTSEVFTVDPVSVFIWKRLDGKHTKEDIVKDLRERCDGVPKDAATHVGNFMEDLVKRGLAGHELKAD